MESKLRHLSQVDAHLVRLYMTACVNDWKQLPDIVRSLYKAGGSVSEVRGCLRHLIVLAGYGPCLAAFLALGKERLLPDDTPGKIGGPESNAFELVYASVSDAVGNKVFSADPVLSEWIRTHLYGDVYGSPGIDMRQKQLLMCARLAQADMGEQLFGHALAGLRFGLSKEQLEEAVEIGADCAALSSEVFRNAMQVIHMAETKYLRDMNHEPANCPQVVVQSENIVLPKYRLLGRKMPELCDDDDKVKFTWEEIERRDDVIWDD